MATISENDPNPSIDSFAWNISTSWSVFCLLIRVRSDYCQPMRGQVTEVTCSVIGQVQPELTPSKRQKTGTGFQIGDQHISHFFAVSCECQLIQYKSVATQCCLLLRRYDACQRLSPDGRAAVIWMLRYFWQKIFATASSHWSSTVYRRAIYAVIGGCNKANDIANIISPWGSVSNFPTWNVRNVWRARGDGHHYDVTSKCCGITITKPLVECTLSVSEIN